MRRLITILALSALVAACQSGNTNPVASPLPTPTPHTAATDAVLQSADIPAGLSPCLGSGPIDVYVTTLAHADATLAGQVGAQWEQLRVAGATAGAISLFTASPAACNAELAATSNVKSVTAFVGLFADPGQADRAWGSGVFGFEPPVPAEIRPGVTRGTATGLGLSSWTYDRAPVQLACWHKSVFVALVVVSNLDAATFKAATTAIDARLN
ncbi:MAG TPA: hypothetical protein VIJ58_09755 [Candidatus Dormibacteraeota bacterium]